MAVDTFTVVPQLLSGIPQFLRPNIGTCSPSTSSAVANSPLVNLVYDYFSFTIIRLAGRYDNSSITSFTLTPSGGSTLTFNVNTFTYYSSSNESQWGSSDSYRNLVAGTTYTLQLFSGATSVATESATLERRTPTGFDDFYGATRNVPAVSGEFKLSWLKNAVKYSHTSAMTSVQYTHAPGGFAVATYTGYSTTILPALGLSGTLGSMNSPTVSGIINYYQGATVQQLMQSTFPSSPSQVIITFIMDQTALDANSQWYKVSLTPTGGGTEIAFYREDLTYSRSGSRHTWTKDYGTPQLANGTTNYDFKLVC